MSMEKYLSIHSLEALQRLIDEDVMMEDESYIIGTVDFEDATMLVMLQGTEDGTFLQGVILGLGNDETKNVTDVLDVEGYRVRLV